MDRHQSKLKNSINPPQESETFNVRQEPHIWVIWTLSDASSFFSDLLIPPLTAVLQRSNNLTNSPQTNWWPTSSNLSRLMLLIYRWTFTTCSTFVTPIVQYLQYLCFIMHYFGWSCWPVPPSWAALILWPSHVRDCGIGSFRYQTALQLQRRRLA